jgi:hypothetical protein
MSDISWTPVKIELGDLIAWDINPRQSTKKDAERLIATEKRFGQPIPFCVSPYLEGSKVNCYDGHQRLNAWQKVYGLGFVVWAMQSDRHLSEDERKDFVLQIHNARGQWNADILSGWGAETLKGGWFDSDTLKDWKADVNWLGEFLKSEAQTGAEAEEELETKDRFEEIAAKWETAPNQLWQAGEHYLYCGDSLDPESIATVLRGQEPVLVNADPPYGVSIVAANVSVGGGESAKGMIPFGGVKNRRGTVGASKPFGSKAERGSDGAAHVVEVGKYPVVIGDENTETAKKAIELYLERFDNAYHVWWGANYYVESVEPSPCWLVWNKETTGNFADCELAWTNADMPAKLFTHRWNGMLRDSERERRWHPTQKPALLAEWLIGLFSYEGDVILDPFGGAGWTVLAAEACKRKACIIEKAHEYLAVQLERLSVKFPALDIRKVE